MRHNAASHPMLEAIFEFIFFIVVVCGVIAIDHRLLTLVKIQRELLDYIKTRGPQR
jgi:hypothetical protein